jgi:hypothetical protein
VLESRRASAPMDHGAVFVDVGLESRCVVRAFDFDRRGAG